jgi:integrase
VYGGNWSIAEGMIDCAPFKRDDVTLVKLDRHAEEERTRRLQPGERARLLQHANSHLQALIIAALSTRCRVGELLSLQWSQLQRDEQNDTQVIVLPARQQDQDPRPSRDSGVVRVTRRAGDAPDRPLPQSD